MKKWQPFFFTIPATHQTLQIEGNRWYYLLQPTHLLCTKNGNVLTIPACHIRVLAPGNPNAELQVFLVFSKMSGDN